jgi:hypothetical protein
MIQLDVYSIRRMVRKALDMTVIVNLNTWSSLLYVGFILLLLCYYLVCVSAFVCVCACMRACIHFWGGNVEFNKNEEMQLY